MVHVSRMYIGNLEPVCIRCTLMRKVQTSPFWVGTEHELMPAELLPTYVIGTVADVSSARVACIYQIIVVMRLCVTCKTFQFFPSAALVRWMIYGDCRRRPQIAKNRRCPMEQNKRSNYTRSRDKDQGRSMLKSAPRLARWMS